MPVISEEGWHALVRAVRREVVKHFPDWSHRGAGDPGVPLLELFAFLAENLPDRADQMPAEERKAIADRLTRVANALAIDDVDANPCGLVRTRYYYGKLLDVDDFTTEQKYFRDKARRHNRLLHGAGIVTGLSVSVDRGGGGSRVVIAPGFALDPYGEEIEVCEPVSLQLPSKGNALLVQLRYAERAFGPAPAAGAERESEPAQDSRIEETFDASLTPAPDAAAVLLARLRCVKGRWALDRRFKAARVVRSAR